MATENYYIIGGIADANGHSTDPENSFDSLFDDAEYYTHIEIGWAYS